jgi:Spy/CpxP family protein refolding chaperone
MVINPVADKLNQLALELGLTEQQKQQIVPIVKEEIPKLEALKKDTTLSKEKKIEQLREIGKTIDGKVTPLLNPEQQAKYKQMQEERRKKMIEKIGNEAIEKAEEEVKKIW